MGWASPMNLPPLIALFIYKKEKKKDETLKVLVGPGCSTDPPGW